MSNPSFMFIAGDPSGDQNTVPVIRQIYKAIPGSTCYGIGGPMMQAEGFKTLLPFEEFNRMGYVEVLINIRFFMKAKKIDMIGIGGIGMSALAFVLADMGWCVSGSDSQETDITRKLLKKGVDPIFISMGTRENRKSSESKLHLFVYVFCSNCFFRS